MTQCQLLLRHFKDGNSITPGEAINEYGIYRLASRIHDLRRMGYNIAKKSKAVKNRYGDIVHVAEYKMEVNDEHCINHRAACG